jgi:hypothetical protein
MVLVMLSVFELLYIFMLMQDLNDMQELYTKNFNQHNNFVASQLDFLEKATKILLHRKEENEEGKNE